MSSDSILATSSDGGTPPGSATGSSWPTPAAADSGRASGTYAKGNPTLTGAVRDETRMWPTPRAEERMQYNSRPGDTYVALSLAVVQDGLWPTPTAQDSNSSGAADYSTESGRHPGTTLTDHGVRQGGAGTGAQTRVSTSPSPSESPRATPTARDFKSGASSEETRDRNARPLNEQVLWSTPQSRDDRGPTGKAYAVRNKKSALPNEVLWSTPTASMETMADMEQAKWAGNDPHRPTYQAAKDLWPTPTVGDRKGASRGKNAKGSAPLAEVAATEFWSTPMAKDGTSGADVPTANREGGVSLRTQAGAALNAAWVEALQGFPADWTVVSAMPRRGAKPKAMPTKPLTMSGAVPFWWKCPDCEFESVTRREACPCCLRVGPPVEVFPRSRGSRRA
jgi:hypothetical protein